MLKLLTLFVILLEAQPRKMTSECECGYGGICFMNKFPHLNDTICELCDQVSFGLYEDCDKIVNHCSPNPCVQGECVRTFGSFFCRCPKDRFGQRCQISDPSLHGSSISSEMSAYFQIQPDTSHDQWLKLTFIYNVQNVNTVRKDLLINITLDDGRMYYPAAENFKLVNVRKRCWKETRRNLDLFDERICYLLPEGEVWSFEFPTRWPYLVSALKENLVMLPLFSEKPLGRRGTVYIRATLRNSSDVIFEASYRTFTYYYMIRYYHHCVTLSTMVGCSADEKRPLLVPVGYRFIVAIRRQIIDCRGGEVIGSKWHIQRNVHRTTNTPMDNVPVYREEYDNKHYIYILPDAFHTGVHMIQYSYVVRGEPPSYGGKSEFVIDDRVSHRSEKNVVHLQPTQRCISNCYPIDPESSIVVSATSYPAFDGTLSVTWNVTVDSAPVPGVQTNLDLFDDSTSSKIIRLHGTQLSELFLTNNSHPTVDFSVFKTKKQTIVTRSYFLVDNLNVLIPLFKLVDIGNGSYMYKFSPKANDHEWPTLKFLYLIYSLAPKIHVGSILERLETYPDSLVFKPTGNLAQLCLVDEHLMQACTDPEAVKPFTPQTNCNVYCLRDKILVQSGSKRGFWSEILQFTTRMLRPTENDTLRWNIPIRERIMLIDIMAEMEPGITIDLLTINTAVSMLLYSQVGCKSLRRKCENEIQDIHGDFQKLIDYIRLRYYVLTFIAYGTRKTALWKPLTLNDAVETSLKQVKNHYGDLGSHLELTWQLGAEDDSSKLIHRIDAEYFDMSQKQEIKRGEIEYWYQKYVGAYRDCTVSLANLIASWNTPLFSGLRVIGRDYSRFWAVESTYKEILHYLNKNLAQNDSTYQNHAAYVFGPDTPEKHHVTWFDGCQIIFPDSILLPEYSTEIFTLVVSAIPGEEGQTSLSPIIAIDFRHTTASGRNRIGSLPRNQTYIITLPFISGKNKTKPLNTSDLLRKVKLNVQQVDSQCLITTFKVRLPSHFKRWTFDMFLDENMTMKGVTSTSHIPDCDEVASSAVIELEKSELEWPARYVARINAESMNKEFQHFYVTLLPSKVVKSTLVNITCSCHDFGAVWATVENVDVISLLSLGLPITLEINNTLPILGILICVCTAVFILLLWFYGLFVDSHLYKQAPLMHLEDSYPTAEHPLIIGVYTGVNPLSGTKAKVAIKVVGKDSSSRVHILELPYKKTLSWGKDDWFATAVERPLGRITHIHLWHDFHRNSNWKCSEIYLFDSLFFKKWYLVKVDRWFKMYPSDDDTQMVTLPAKEMRPNDFIFKDQEFSSYFFREFYVSHLPFSIFHIHNRSVSTCEERCLMYIVKILSALVICWAFMELSLFLKRHGMDEVQVNETTTAWVLTIAVISHFFLFPISLLYRFRLRKKFFQRHVTRPLTGPREWSPYYAEGKEPRISLHRRKSLGHRLSKALSFPRAHSRNFSRKFSRNLSPEAEHDYAKPLRMPHMKEKDGSPSRKSRREMSTESPPLKHTIEGTEHYLWFRKDKPIGACIHYLFAILIGPQQFRCVNVAFKTFSDRLWWKTVQLRLFVGAVVCLLMGILIYGTIFHSRDSKGDINPGFLLFACLVLVSDALVIEPGIIFLKALISYSILKRKRVQGILRSFFWWSLFYFVLAIFIYGCATLVTTTNSSNVVYPYKEDRSNVIKGVVSSKTLIAFVTEKFMWKSYKWANGKNISNDGRRWGNNPSMLPFRNIMITLLVKNEESGYLVPGDFEPIFSEFLPGFSEGNQETRPVVINKEWRFYQDLSPRSIFTSSLRGASGQTYPLRGHAIPLEREPWKFYYSNMRNNLEALFSNHMTVAVHTATILATTYLLPYAPGMTTEYLIIEDEKCGFVSARIELHRQLLDRDRCQWDDGRPRVPLRLITVVFAVTIPIMLLLNIVVVWQIGARAYLTKLEHIVKPALWVAGFAIAIYGHYVATETARLCQDIYDKPGFVGNLHVYTRSQDSKNWLGVLFLLACVEVIRCLLWLWCPDFVSVFLPQSFHYVGAAYLSACFLITNVQRNWMIHDPQLLPLTSYVFLKQLIPENTVTEILFESYAINWAGPVIIMIIASKVCAGCAIGTYAQVKMEQELRAPQKDRLIGSRFLFNHIRRRRKGRKPSVTEESEHDVLARRLERIPSDSVITTANNQQTNRPVSPGFWRYFVDDSTEKFVTP